MMQLTRSLEILLLFYYIGRKHVDSAGIVNTDVGTITGTTETIEISGTSYQVSKYLGIRYGKAPVGELRFKKPEPAEPFTTPYSATEYGASCNQMPVAGIEPALKRTSEDCLFLNVFVSEQTPDSPTGHAVMVFIHGGGFVVGSGEYYDGRILASYGNVILVTINYRLGFYGYFSTGDQQAPGNMGFFDQHQALQWVNNHITAFGGDKNRVTIFGESAGAISVTSHMFYQPNKGLFQRVIGESGSPTTLETPDAEKAMTSAKGFAKHMGCSDESAEEIVTCLREETATKINSKVEELAMSDNVENLLIMQFIPTVDRDFTKIQPREISKSEDIISDEINFFRTIDFLSGYNSHEGGSYIGTVVATEDPEGFTPTRESMDTKLIPLTLYLSGINYTEIIMRLIRSQYTDWSNPNDPIHLRDQYVQLAGDLAFGVPTIEFAKLHLTDATSASNYVYHFGAKPTVELMPTPSWIDGANHGDEEPFVFGFGVSYGVSINTTRVQWEHELSHTMMTLWSNFAKTGNPNLPVSTTPAWPVYDQERQNYMEFNKDENLVKQYLCAERANLWLETIPNVVSSVTSDCETGITSGADRIGVQLFIYMAIFAVVVMVF